METQERVINTFATVFIIDRNSINITDTKEDIESWDSIGHLQLIMNLEAEFGVKINTEDVVNIDSVEKCLSVVTKLLNSK